MAGRDNMRFWSTIAPASDGREPLTGTALHTIAAPGVGMLHVTGLSFMAAPDPARTSSVGPTFVYAEGFSRDAQNLVLKTAAPAESWPIYTHPETVDPWPLATAEAGCTYSADPCVCKLRCPWGQSRSGDGSTCQRRPSPTCSSPSRTGGTARRGRAAARALGSPRRRAARPAQKRCTRWTTSRGLRGPR